MAQIILVPGGFHGGWYFAPILAALRAKGHEVHTPTLSGLGGARDLHAPINLDTHIGDIIALIEDEQLDDVILCGHSYAGLVIAGAADRLRGRIRTLVFLDALVPRDGDSVWSTWGAERCEAFIQLSPDGLVTNPREFMDARARAHPLACFLQPIRLTQSDYGVSDRVFVWCHIPEEGPYRAIHQQVVDEGGWTVHSLASTHDFMRDAPEEIMEIILAAAERRPVPAPAK